MMKGVFITLFIALIGVEGWWLTWLTYGRIGAALFLLVPLLVCLPWVISGGHRARLIGSLVSLPYLVHGITESVSAEPPRTAAFAVTGLCLALYGALVLARRPQGVTQAREPR